MVAVKSNMPETQNKLACNIVRKKRRSMKHECYHLNELLGVVRQDCSLNLCFLQLQSPAVADVHLQLRHLLGGQHGRNQLVRQTEELQIGMRNLVHGLMPKDVHGREPAVLFLHVHKLEDVRVPNVFLARNQPAVSLNGDGLRIIVRLYCS